MFVLFLFLFCFTKKTRYTEVDVSLHNGQKGLDVIHITVDYADIQLRPHPEGLLKFLVLYILFNPPTLQQILGVWNKNSMKKSYNQLLFGAVR